MEDIVSRLRVLNFMGPWSEAADEIEQSRKKIEQYENKIIRLREALWKIKELSPFYSDEGSLTIEQLVDVLFEMSSISSSALKEKE
jgi:phage regulator Rha-like protein